MHKAVQFICTVFFYDEIGWNAQKPDKVFGKLAKIIFGFCVKIQKPLVNIDEKDNMYSTFFIKFQKIIDFQKKKLYD